MFPGGLWAGRGSPHLRLQGWPDELSPTVWSSLKALEENSSLGYVTQAVIPIFLLSDASSILSQEIEGKGCCSPTTPHIPTYKNAHATQSLGAVQGVFLCHGSILTWASV